jgi:hypothetical protein
MKIYDGDPVTGSYPVSSTYLQNRSESYRSYRREESSVESLSHSEGDFLESIRQVLVEVVNALYAFFSWFCCCGKRAKTPIELIRTEPEKAADLLIKDLRFGEALYNEILRDPEWLEKIGWTNAVRFGKVLMNKGKEVALSRAANWFLNSIHTLTGDWG